MPVLIENPENGLYMNVASRWAAKAEAYDFRTPSLAIELCMMRRLRNVRIIVDVGDAANDFTLIVCGPDRAVAASNHKRTRRSATGKTADHRGTTNGHHAAERSPQEPDVAALMRPMDAPFL